MVFYGIIMVVYLWSDSFGMIAWIVVDGAATLNAKLRAGEEESGLELQVCDMIS